MREFWFDQIWSARKRNDGALEPNTPISGVGIGPEKDSIAPAMRRHAIEHFSNAEPGEPFFVLIGRFHLVTAANEAEPEDLTIAPGAADLTFGSVLSEMIRRSFQRVDGSAGPEARHYAECLHCYGNDVRRAVGRRPSLDLIEHKPGCLLAKHLPRLRAMANKGAT